MSTALFTRKLHNGIAAAVSLLALAGVLFYVGGSSSAIAANMTAYYAHAKQSAVQGVVKALNGRPDKNGKVVLVFRNGRGRIVKRVAVKVNRKGRFHVSAPKVARTVALTVYLRPGKKAPHGTRRFHVANHRALKVTVVFHRSGHGILPAVFPY